MRISTKNNGENYEAEWKLRLNTPICCRKGLREIMMYLQEPKIFLQCDYEGA